MVRLVVAARMPLSADEAYYRVWSQALAPGYLDHPPMVALWIRAGTLLAGGSALGIRLLGPLSALAGSLLLARATTDFVTARQQEPAVAGASPINPKHAGIVAACLLNATLLLNVGSVVMTPDTPLLFFWTAALAALARLLRTGQPNWWLATGAAAGLALDCKYTAILLAPALLAWLLMVPAARHWLRCWQLWAGLAIALAVFSPVIAWNASHGWASFAKQGGRTGDWRPADAMRFIAELVGGQAGLATPLVFSLFCAGVWRAARRARRDQSAGLLAAVTLVPSAIFLQHALGGRVQANWPAIVYPGAAIAAALWARRWWKPATCLGIAMALAVFLQAAWAPLVLPRRLDFTLIRLAGWSDLAGAAYVASTQQQARFVAADEYGLASELAFRLTGEVVSVEPRFRLFDLRRVSLKGRTGILVRSERQLGPPDPRIWDKISDLGVVVRQRNGIVAETYRLYRVEGSPLDAALLPSARPTISP